MKKEYSSVEYVVDSVRYFVDYYRAAYNAPVTFPLSAVDGMCGYGLYCSQGFWVTSVDPSIADDVLAIVNKGGFVGEGK